MNNLVRDALRTNDAEGKDHTIFQSFQKYVSRLLANAAQVVETFLGFADTFSVSIEPLGQKYIKIILYNNRKVLNTQCILINNFVK